MNSQALAVRRLRPASEGGPTGRDLQWLGPAVAPWGVVRVDGLEPPLTQGFPVTVTGASSGAAPAVGQSAALYPVLTRNDVPELFGGGGATLTLRPLGPLEGFRVVGQAETDQGILTLLEPAQPGSYPSVIDVQELHAVARAAGGGLVVAVPFPFARREEPPPVEGPDLGEYAVAAVGGLLVGMVVARYW